MESVKKGKEKQFVQIDFGLLCFFTAVPMASETDPFSNWSERWNLWQHELFLFACLLI